MARARRRIVDVAGGQDAELRGPALDRIANLLALILIRGENELDKVRTLAAAGYTPSEMARMLGKQPNTVSVLLYKSRQGNKGRRMSRRRGAAS